MIFSDLSCKFAAEKVSVPHHAYNIYIMYKI